MSSSNVVIIGAGPGGLAAAMLLSAVGARVTVLERSDRVGGRTSAFEAKGYRFDLGPTFFLYPQTLREIFSACGMDFDERVEMKRLDPHYRLYFEGSDSMLARPDEASMENEIQRISSGDAGGFRRFMADNRKKFAAFAPVLQRPMSSPWSVVRPNLLPALPFLRLGKSVEADFRSFFKDERLRLACAFQSKYLGMSPFTCPSIFTILSFLEYEYGIYHPIGGCSAVSEAMAAAAKELGAAIRLAEPVTHLEFEGRRATGAITEEGRYPCDALVINADFAQAMSTLVPSSLRRKWSDEALRTKKYSCSTFMLYLGVKRRFPELNHHTVFLADAYRENLSDIEKYHRLSNNPSFYVCNPTLKDPGMAPEGKSILYVLVPVTHRHENVDWDRQARGYRDVVIRQLAKIGIANIEEDIEFERILTPADWENQYAVKKGAVFNLSHSLDQILFRRPRNRFEELDRVYLVGGGTHPGSGLPVIYESARITCGLLQEDLGL